MSCRSFAIATVLSIFTQGIPLAGCSNPLADAHYNNALDKYDEGNYEAAIKLLDNAITIREEAEYYGDRANAKISLQDHEDVVKDYNKATEINSEYATAYYNRALAKEGLGDIKGAMKDYNNAIKYNPDSEIA